MEEVYAHMLAGFILSWGKGPVSVTPEGTLEAVENLMPSLRKKTRIRLRQFLEELDKELMG